MQVRLLQKVPDGTLVRRRLLNRRPLVAQDGGIDAVGEARSVSTIRVRTDPVVVDGLVSIKLRTQPSAQFLFAGSGDTYDEGVPLGRENLQSVDLVRLGVLPIRLNDCHGVAIDSEVVVRVA